MIWQEGFSQYVYGTTGLLHMPTADMQRDKTFLFGASYLDVAATPAHWNYHTLNITPPDKYLHSVISTTALI